MFHAIYEAQILPMQRSEIPNSPKSKYEILNGCRKFIETRNRNLAQRIKDKQTNQFHEEIQGNRFTSSKLETLRRKFRLTTIQLSDISQALINHQQKDPQNPN